MVEQHTVPLETDAARMLPGTNPLFEVAEGDISCSVAPKVGRQMQSSRQPPWWIDRNVSLEEGKEEAR